MKLTREKIIEELENSGLRVARMLSYDKSFYCEKHPKNVVLFNANIFDRKLGKIWYGDLDLTLDGKKINEVAKKLETTFYVLKEMNGRFENENNEDCIKLAKWSTDQAVHHLEEI